MQKQQTKMEDMQDSGEQCIGIHELIDWQIIQYRKEVDAHRLDLSQVEKRCVAWQEAEQDFNAEDRIVMGKKWRVEYCGSICPSKDTCLVAAHFLRNVRDDAEPLYRAG